MHWLIHLLNRCGNASLRFGKRPGSKAIALAQAHFQANAALQFDGYIEEQMRGAASQVRMGQSLLEPAVRLLQRLGLAKRALLPGYNACGWVAVYNTLLALGRRVHPAQIVQMLELNRGLNADGLFGTDPRAFASAFERLGCRATAYFDLEPGLDARLRTAGGAVLCAVNPGGILHGAHNISIHWDAAAGAYRTHNAGLRGTCRSLDELLAKTGMKLLSLTLAEPASASVSDTGSDRSSDLP